jgi:hypothetical protein
MPRTRLQAQGFVWFHVLYFSQTALPVVSETEKGNQEEGKKEIEVKV